MSHITTIKTRMTEAAPLVAALGDLGFDVEQGDLSLGGLMGQPRRVEIKVRPRRLSDAIGFKKVDGQFAIVADWWGVKGVQRDPFVRQLTQRYAYRVALAKLEQQGFELISEENEADGRIRLQLRRLA